MPARVEDYLCIGSQYTNGRGLGPYGLISAATLVGNRADPTMRDEFTGPASLGNFGGYITYYFEDAIMDDPRNPYGVDFVIVGNSVFPNAAYAEPGQVWVSEDGADWYALAGALHYDNSTLWDYKVTYSEHSNGKSMWTDQFGASAVSPSYDYPKPENYPMHTFGQGESGEGASITMSGILLGSAQGENEYGNTLPNFPLFGYADVGRRTMSNEAGNPYQGLDSNGLQTADVMDLAWAVDADGYPVTFPNGVHYVKVVTANNIDNGAIGEKSTEINMLRVAAAAESSVGATAAPAAITVGGVNVPLQDGVYLYTVPVATGAYEVSVATTADNVFINSQRTKTLAFASIPNHGIIRVIVQDGDKEPLIYYLTLTDSGETGTGRFSEITFRANGGSIDGQSVVIRTYLETSDDKTFPVPTRLSHEFLGWFDDNGVRVEQYDASLPETLTLNAAWRYTGAAIDPGSGNIRVSFRLVGSTLTDVNPANERRFDVDLDGNDPAGYHGAEYITWVGTSSHRMPEKSSVYDLFVKALADAGLTSVGADYNYVRSITSPAALGDEYALAEMTNGPYSGWMYTINGKHPGFGLMEQTLKDGDVVIWHYVNDYRYEVSDWFDELYYSAIGDGSLWSRWLLAEDIRPGAGDPGGGTPAGDNNEDADMEDEEVPLGEFEGWENPFADVKAADWFYEAVAFTQTSGLMIGTADDAFSPNSNLSRAMIVTMLWRMEGEPTVGQGEPTVGQVEPTVEQGASAGGQGSGASGQGSDAAPFTDIIKGEWYYDAVLWASENGIVEGYGDGSASGQGRRFGPEDDITREQLATILYRYAEYKGLDTAQSMIETLASFTDAGLVSEYADSAMRWANRHGLIIGRTATTLAPQGTATRAEAATILMRFVKGFAEE